MAEKGTRHSHMLGTKDLKKARRKDIITLADTKALAKGSVMRAKGAKEKERMASRETVYGAGSLATAEETVPTKTIT